MPAATRNIEYIAGAQDGVYGRVTVRPHGTTGAFSLQQQRLVAFVPDFPVLFNFQLHNEDIVHVKVDVKAIRVCWCQICVELDRVTNFTFQPAPDDMSRQACMLTRTLVDTRTTDPAIAAATRDYLAAIQDEFAAAFVAAQNAGELSADADPNRLARRFQANVTALRLALHQGMGPEDFAQLAEDMAREIEDLRVKA